MWNPLRGRWITRNPPHLCTGGKAISSLEAALEDEGAPGGRAAPAAAGTLHELPLRPPAGALAAAGVLLRACRPRQWAKNSLVLAAPCAAGLIGSWTVIAQVAGAFAVLCMVSSATYLVNDVRDRDQDRMHPRKRHRPVASGELSFAAALRAAAVLAVLGIALGAAIAPGLGALAAGYLALTASYSIWLRHIVVLDMLAIAAGFVLRALAGGVATDIYISRWFLIVTGACAIYLVAAKRYAELSESATPQRATLRRYSARGLRMTLGAAALVAGGAYIGWALSRPTHLVWYSLSIIPFLLWLGRYAALVGAGAGEAPEELILHDRVLLALGAVWAALFMGGVYVGG